MSEVPTPEAETPGDCKPAEGVFDFGKTPQGVAIPFWYKLSDATGWPSIRITIFGTNNGDTFVRSHDVDGNAVQTWRVPRNNPGHTLTFHHDPAIYHYSAICNDNVLTGRIKWERDI